MAYVDRESGVVTLRIVLCGPGGSGKTTSLRALHRSLPEHQVSEVVDTGPAVERTQFFEYFASELGTISGMDVCAEFFSVPGQAYYAEARRTILERADGLIFVADSDPLRWVANLKAHVDMMDIVTSTSRKVAADDLPILYQWNKRDLPDAVPVERLEEALNRDAAPSLTSVAETGEGIRESATRVVEDAVAVVRATQPRLLPRPEHSGVVDVLQQTCRQLAHTMGAMAVIDANARQTATLLHRAQELVAGLSVSNPSQLRAIQQLMELLGRAGETNFATALTHWLASAEGAS